MSFADFTDGQTEARGGQRYHLPQSHNMNALDLLSFLLPGGANAVKREPGSEKPPHSHTLQVLRRHTEL